jgi:hypothetical protein
MTMVIIYTVARYCIFFITPRYPYSSLKPVPGIRWAFVNAPWGAHQGETP